MRTGGEQGLDEQGVAFAALVDLLDELRLGFAAQYCPGLCGDLTLSQA